MTAAGWNAWPPPAGIDRVLVDLAGEVEIAERSAVTEEWWWVAGRNCRFVHEIQGSLEPLWAPIPRSRR